MIRSQKKIGGVNVAEEVASSSQSAVSTGENALGWFNANKNKVFIGLGVLVAAVVGFFFWNSGRSEDNAKANAMLSRIVQSYQMGNYRAAIDGEQRMVGNEKVVGLKTIVDQFGSTPAGEQAKVYLANCYYYMGQLDSAKTVLDASGATVPIVKATVEAGKATIFAEKGNKEEAAKLFISAASMDKSNPFNADYTLAAAKNYQAIGKSDEAIKAYKTLLEEYQGSYHEDFAKRELLKLKVEL